MTTFDEAFIDLQMRVTFQEDMLSQLNDIVSKQDADILLLREQIRTLAQRLEESMHQSSEGENNLVDERPPHY